MPALPPRPQLTPLPEEGERGTARRLCAQCDANTCECQHPQPEYRRHSGADVARGVPTGTEASTIPAGQAAVRVPTCGVDRPRSRTSPGMLGESAVSSTVSMNPSNMANTSNRHRHWLCSLARAGAIPGSTRRDPRVWLVPPHSWFRKTMRHHAVRRTTRDPPEGSRSSRHCLPVMTALRPPTGRLGSRPRLPVSAWR